MEPVRFAIAGAGWRAEFFLRIAEALPDRFEVTSVLARRPERGAEIERRWGVKTCQDLERLIGSSPAFVVVSVPWVVSPELLTELSARKTPVLAETPPAPDADGLKAIHRLVQRGARIQVAEQYHLQPFHAARLAISGSGMLGDVTQAQVAVAHGYHGVSLIRRFLGLEFENANVTAHRFVSPLAAGPGRDGPPKDAGATSSSQTIAYLDFGDRLGVFDFTGDQYFSWIRSPRVLVRGVRGEINNGTVRYLDDTDAPITIELLRQDAGQQGNLEGYYHKGYLAGSNWVYRNPFVPGRLSDDEIAIASCLEKTAAYAAGGPEFYSVAEAAQDHYLGMMIDRAAASGERVATETQAWAH